MGYRGRALGFAGLVLRARQRSARQARMLLREVEQAMVANRERVPATRQANEAWNSAIPKTG